MKTNAKVALTSITLILGLALAGPARAQVPTSRPTSSAIPEKPDAHQKPEHLTQPKRPAKALELSKKHWYQRFVFDAFIDGYYSVNFNFPKPERNTVLRGFDTANGFALHWAGLDVTYPTEPIGATISLRLGPGALRFNGNDADHEVGLEYLDQAFVSYRPVSWLQLDFGKFGTIFGAEVGESQRNFNYTRGGLNWLAQPFFHTGLRAAVNVGDKLTITALAVNGWNNTLDNNTMKSFGLQAALTLGPISVTAGYLMGPEEDEVDANGAEVDGANERLRHFVDLIVGVDAGALQLLLNADFGAEDKGEEHQLWYGVSVAAQYSFAKRFAVAYRFEYINDPDGWMTSTADLWLLTNTLTLGVSIADHLLIRLDGRLDYANKEVCHEGATGFSKTQETLTLGVVVFAG